MLYWVAPEGNLFALNPYLRAIDPLPQIFMYYIFIRKHPLYGNTEENNVKDFNLIIINQSILHTCSDNLILFTDGHNLWNWKPASFLARLSS